MSFQNQEAGWMAGVKGRSGGARVGAGRKPLSLALHRLHGTTSRARGPVVVPTAGSGEAVPAASWAADVRARYELNATEQQLLALADTALTIAHDGSHPASARLAAMGRFQALLVDLKVDVEEVALAHIEATGRR
jgi:hypothetical protein